MRPLTSLDLSTLIDYFPFSKSRRTASPFTDEEANSSGLPSLGKFCNEKPYDGACPDLAHPGHKYRHISQCQNHPPKPSCGRGHRDVRTHRSRIESYTPEMLDYVTKEKSKPSSTAKGDLASEKRLTSSLVDPPPQVLHHLKRKTYPTTAAPLSMNPPPPKSRPSSTNPTSRRALPLSMNPPPPKLKPSSTDQNNPTSRRTPPLSMNPPPPKLKPSSTSKGPPSTTAKPLSINLPPSQPHSSSTSSTKPKPPPPPPPKSNRATHRSSSTPSAPAKKHPIHKPHRLSEEEMNERYARWYQGRGSEIGRGFWGVEIVPPAGGVKAADGRGVSVGDNDRKIAEQSSTWEIIGKEGRSRGTTRGSLIGIGVAKSRLSS
ncbi:MAG: hypothetical protein L6R42_010510 [Xanthoria sp. 1 TBL-2021]|nr:MAG: hypothetical protein L6R42_010510 [Xanthoria sp. 1 TBL-2021]